MSKNDRHVRVTPLGRVLNDLAGPKTSFIAPSDVAEAEIVDKRRNTEEGKAAWVDSELLLQLEIRERELQLKQAHNEVTEREQQQKAAELEQTRRNQLQTQLQLMQREQQVQERERQVHQREEAAKRREETLTQREETWTAAGYAFKPS